MKIALFIIFLLGMAVGQTSRNSNLSVYGCTWKQQAQAEGGNTPVAVHTVCIVYDPNMDKHFIVSTVTSTNGAGTAIVEEK